jgi:hypothetical protein
VRAAGAIVGLQITVCGHSCVETSEKNEEVGEEAHQEAETGEGEGKENPRNACEERAQTGQVSSEDNYCLFVVSSIVGCC